jgi:hypothetical protein
MPEETNVSAEQPSDRTARGSAPAIALASDLPLFVLLNNIVPNTWPQICNQGKASFSAVASGIGRVQKKASKGDLLTKYSLGRYSTQRGSGFENVDEVNYARRSD